MDDLVSGLDGVAREATRWLRELDVYAGPPWTVDELTLVQSHLPRENGRRPRHEVLASLPRVRPRTT